MSIENYMPKVTPDELCSALQLCSVRQRGNEYFVAVKKLDESMSEILFVDIANADSYQDKPIVRTYSSGHGFFNEEHTKVFLLTVEKKWTKQVQFTWGSPLEEINKDVVFHKDRQIQFHLWKIEENALIRTKNRTWVDVLSHWNELPLVDWALIENTNDEWKTYRRLVCLLHYIVKSYEGKLEAQIWVEDVIGGQRYDIQDIIDNNVEHIAPNASIIIQKALEIMKSVL